METDYYKEYLENKKKNKIKLAKLTEKNIKIQKLYHKIMGMNEYNKDETILEE